MGETLKDRTLARAWQRKYDGQAPKFGDLAPDFMLFDSDGQNPVQLSNIVGQKPVALIFGSFT